ncbi:MAG: septum formation initiator family protein [Candidatus Microgenomates bacterium]|jgi:cell division protein FtsB
MRRIAENLKIKAKKLFGLAVWVLAVLLLISTVKNITKVASVRSAVEAEKEKVAKMEADNQKLQAQIAQTQGSEFIEKQIRDELGLAKPGEAIVVLPDEATLRQLAPQTPVEEESLPDPNWVKWEKLFF